MEANIEIVENKVCTLEFVASGIPLPTVQWIKDKVILVENERIVLQIEAIPDRATYRLIIQNCKTEDSGQYTAKIKNILGEATTQTKLNVLYGPKFVKSLLPEYNIKEHEGTKLTTEVIANPKADISWFKRESAENIGEPLRTSDKFKVEAQQNTNSLSLKDTLITDAGDYICMAKNIINEAVSLAKISVGVPPKFLQPPEIVKEVEMGADTRFKCTIRSNPLPQVQFIKLTDQTAVSNECESFSIQSIQLNDYEVEYIFSVKAVSPTTCTTFECKASNVAGDVNAKFGMNVIHKPEFFKTPDECINLIESKEIIINCQVLAWPDATLAWFKDGVKINQSKRIQFIDDKSKTQGVKSYSMKILSANKEDAGSYEIVATNKLGEVRCGFRVLIEYAPIIVKDLKAKEKCVEDSSFVFECAVKGFPKPEIKWYFEDKEITAESIEYKLSADEVNRLSIEKVTTQNSGHFKLVAKNTLGSVQTIVSEFYVETRPVVIAKFEAPNKTADSCEFFDDEGKSLEFDFDVSGKPQPALEYFKDDVKFKPTEKRVTLVKRENGCKLSIPEIKSTDAGIYIVNAKNSCGEKPYAIYLRIKSAPKFVKTLKNKIEAIENTKLELNTSLVPGVYPDPIFKWFKNDEYLDELQAINYLIVKDGNGSTLIIENLDFSQDQVKFKLVCSNELGQCETETMIDVLGVPKFNMPLNDCQPLLNQPFEWPFEVDSNPEPKLKLFKSDREVTIGKDNRIKLNKGAETMEFRKIYKYKLIFTNVLAEDLGTYRIEVSNKAGEANSQGQMTVKGTACFIKKPVDTAVVLGKPIKIECEIAGIPLPELVWLKDGGQIVENDRIKIENKLKTIYWINLKTCSKEDSGLYTIKIANDSGSAEATYNMSIQSKINKFIYFLLRNNFFLYFLKLLLKSLRRLWPICS